MGGAAHERAHVCGKARLELRLAQTEVFKGELEAAPHACGEIGGRRGGGDLQQACASPLPPDGCHVLDKLPRGAGLGSGVSYPLREDLMVVDGLTRPGDLARAGDGLSGQGLGGGKCRASVLEGRRGNRGVGRHRQIPS